VVTGLTVTNASVASLNAGTAVITTGNLTFSGTAQRITGDFGNATIANRLAFQTNITNTNTTVHVLPNGTGNVSTFSLEGDASAANCSTGQISIISTTDYRINSGIRGTGTYLPMTFYTGGSERVRIDTSGNVGIGTASPGQKLDLNGNGIVSGLGNSLYIYNTQFGLGTPNSDGLQLFYGDADKLRIGTRTGAGVFSEKVRIDSEGRIGIGGTAAAFTKVDLLGTLPTSSNFSEGYRVAATIPSGTTNTASMFVTYPSTAAASFTLGTLAHFRAIWNSTGAGSAITTQYGFLAESSLTQATNNYGFYSNIASGSNRWNFYAAGTAQNYMAGRLGINNTAFVDSEMLRVTQSSANTGVFIDITAASSTASAGLAIRKQDNDNTTAQTYVAFAFNAGASGAGGIQGNGGSGPQFFNSSDARLKENVADLDGQLAKILALKPRKFDFINGPKDCTGFIAQEMETVYPDAVGEDVDGFKTIGGISIMEARLIKAIQELTARVAELEAK
jgi:hypothetical protein